jgi:hypothetical protein
VIPSPLELLVLSLGAFRVYRLLGQDEILSPLRDRITGAKVLREQWEFERPKIATFLTCPWCCGFWVSLLVYGTWLSDSKLTLYAMTPFAISAAVGLIARNLDD